jgi:para-aminobenzoate synthetase component 1
MKNEDAVIKTMNSYGERGIPFLFIIDYKMAEPIALPLDEIDETTILFDINGFKNFTHRIIPQKEIIFKKHPVSLHEYRSAYQKVLENINAGNTYLQNLTFPTEIETNLTLEEIFFLSSAKHKLLYRDQFVVFSPEIFVQIRDNIISSFPMKGTIDASVDNAEDNILCDQKEFAEHNTIVDLIRNDLNMVAKKICVEKFRYIDKIKTHEKELLQVSSKITGQLDGDYSSKIGDIIFTLLPAGSVTGAPKKKTVEIINQVEKYERGFYTGIFGYFDGKYLDSGVMIRFIERENDKLIFKSGGGITSLSNVESEYQEMIDKVYVPIV